MSGPLDGVRVVEFTWVIAGPLMTKYLALLGADVIRVESARRAEFRARGGNFALLNDSKRSCRLDLSQPRAQALARDLVATADVVVENFGAGVLDRLGLGYDALRARRPDLIMLSCSGVGRVGPDRDKLAYGTLLQLTSGWSMLQGPPGSDEIVIGGAWTDPLAAATGAFAILAALYDRRRTGAGRCIDLSMVETTLGGVPESLMDVAMNGRVPPRLGNRDPRIAPHGCYPCLGDDAWVALAARDEREWAALCRALGHPDWSTDPRFADSSARKANEDALDDVIAAATRQMTRDQAVAIMRAAGVPVGPFLSPAELLADPGLQARGAFVETAAPDGARRQTIGAPWRITPGLTPTYRPAPRLGQHDEDVFKGILGLDDAEIAELVTAEVIF
jgi:benzylsuccinate CoA-transferase BbsF subunit